MTNIKTLISDIPEYAEDIKVNIKNILSRDNKVLTCKQIFGAALAAAYTTKEKRLIANIESESKYHLDKQEFRAVKIATSIMSMNNIYHRFTRIANDEEYRNMPSGLSANATKEHGIEQVDFEIFALAVSIINACPDCIEHHSKEILNHGMTKAQVQMVAKIAAVINASGQVLRIEEIVE